MRIALYFLGFFVFIGYSCREETKETKTTENPTAAVDSITIFTQPSKLENTYLNFDSPKAVNRIAEIENV